MVYRVAHPETIPVVFLLYHTRQTQRMSPAEDLRLGGAIGNWAIPLMTGGFQRDKFADFRFSHPLAEQTYCSGKRISFLIMCVPSLGHRVQREMVMKTSNDLFIMRCHS
jgi:hypothetical protein